MKKIVIKMIEWYQSISKHKNPTCRYRPTCSAYAKEAFQKRNFFIAGFLSAYRILRCNPFSKGGYDPVPKKKHKHHSIHYLDITLQNENNNTTFTLKDFKGDPIILVFYTHDIVSNIDNFETYIDDFIALGYTVILISNKQDKTLRIIDEIYSSKCILLNDPDRKLINAFDIMNKSSDLEFITPSLFILDKQGKITKQCIPIRTKDDLDTILTTLV